MFETMNLPTYHLERIVKNRMQELNIKFYRKPLPREQQRATASNNELQRQSRQQQQPTTHPAEHEQRHAITAPRNDIPAAQKEAPRRQPTVQFATADPPQPQATEHRRGHASTHASSSTSTLAPPFGQREAPPRNGARSTNPRSIVQVPRANHQTNRQSDNQQVNADTRK